LYSGTSIENLQAEVCRIFGDSNIGNLIVGTVYYVRVQKEDSNTGSYPFSLCIKSVSNIPNNDDCNDAENITVSNSFLSCENIVSGNIKNATYDINSAYNPPICTGYEDKKDVWYKFIATSNKMVIQGVPNTEYFDLTYGLYTGNCNVLQCINMLSGSIYYSQNLWTFEIDTSVEVLNNLIVGQQYYLRIYDMDSTALPDNNSFKFCISTPPIVENDLASTAKLITASPDFTCTETTTEYAAFAAPSTISCPNSFWNNNPDRWYKFVATSNEHVMIFSGKYDFVIRDVQFFSGEQGNLICEEISEVEIGIFNGATFVFSNLTIGETYFIRILEVSTNGVGTYTFCIKTPLPIPENDKIENAIPLIPSDNLITCNPIQLRYNRAGQENDTPDPSCATIFDEDNKDVWFSFVATDKNYQLSVYNPNPTAGFQSYRTVLYKKSSSGDLQEIYCFNPFAEPQVSSQGVQISNGDYIALILQNYTDLQIGEIYYIRMYNDMDLEQGGVGILTHLIEMPYEICLKKYPEISANNLVENAVSLEVNSEETCSYTAGYTTRAKFENTSPYLQCPEGSWVPFNNLGSEVWYKFTATAPSHKVTINNFAEIPYPMDILLQTSLTKFPVYVSLYEGTPENITYVLCRQYTDPYAIFSNLNIGQTYYIKVFYEEINFFTDYNFEICISETNLAVTENPTPKDITIYPNPTSDKLFIKTDGKIEKIDIFSADGKLIRFLVPKDNSIDISDLPLGNYIIRLLTKDGYVYKKVIKK
jgi:hypothetical protein